MLWGCGASPEPKSAGPRQQLTATLRPDTTPPSRALLEIHGTEVVADGSFKVSGRLTNVPCNGRYRFASLGEKLATAEVDEYTTTMTLSGFRTVGAPRACGGPVRGGWGAKAATLAIVGDNGESITATGRLVADGTLEGELKLNGGLCNGKYTLAVQFQSTRGQTRAYHYDARVTAARFRGGPVPCFRLEVPGGVRGRPPGRPAGDGPRVAS